MLVAYLSWTSVFLPFIFIVSALMVSKLKTPLGQPNVLVGGVLFYLSVLSLSRAGILGSIFWDGIATLITGVGGGIVLIATSFVGLIILFNTSLNQALTWFNEGFSLVKRFVLGQEVRQVKTSGIRPRRGLRPASLMKKNRTPRPTFPTEKRLKPMQIALKPISTWEMPYISKVSFQTLRLSLTEPFN